MTNRTAHAVLASILLMGIMLNPASLAAQESKLQTAPTSSKHVDWPNETLGDFQSAAFIKAAIELQAMGRDKACDALQAHAAQSDLFIKNIDVVVLCRMLFVAGPGHKFRRPMVGSPAFLGRTTFTDWPLEPITISDGVPFAIAMGYAVGGFPEPPLGYLEYCMKNCEWNSYKYTPKTKTQLEQALDDLLNSSPLQGHADEWDREFFAKQTH